MNTQTNEQKTKCGLLSKGTRAISRSAMVACALLSAVAMVAPARAQNPPPGAIFDLATTTQHTGVLSSYQPCSPPRPF